MLGGRGRGRPLRSAVAQGGGVLRASKFTTGAFIAAAAISASASARQQTAEVADGKQRYRRLLCDVPRPRRQGRRHIEQVGLGRSPADLTQLAKKNNGQFPADTVAKFIDGRTRDEAHLKSDMPVWGDVFAKSQTSSSPEEVKARIDALVKYIETLQQKRSSAGGGANRARLPPICGGEIHEPAPLRVHP